MWHIPHMKTVGMCVIPSCACIRISMWMSANYIPAYIYMNIILSYTARDGRVTEPATGIPMTRVKHATRSYLVQCTRVTRVPLTHTIVTVTYCRFPSYLLCVWYDVLVWLGSYVFPMRFFVWVFPMFPSVLIYVCLTMRGSRYVVICSVICVVRYRCCNVRSCRVFICVS